VHILPVSTAFDPHSGRCAQQQTATHAAQHARLTPFASLFAIRTASARRLLLVAAVLLFGGLSAFAQANTVSQIRVVGNRRIPKETILARLFTHPGDTYDPLSVERDFNSLWNTSYFEDLRIEKEDTPTGILLNVYVRERPTIREINYKGLNAVTQSDVLDRFKKEKVGLSVESQYDPTRIKRAETVLKAILSEHGHQFATIRTEVKTIPPAAVQVNFNIKEGPTVKVGNISFVGNTHYPKLALRRSMRNLRPVGIPHSLIFEDLFPKTFDSSKLDEDAERVRQAYRDKGYYKASVDDPQTHVRDEGGLSLITFRPRRGKRMDIRIKVDEGERYRLSGITFSGNKAVTNVRALRATFANKDGEWFNATQIGKGLENLRKAYGQLGYINMGAIPEPKIDEAKKTVSFNVDIDEGKPFYVSRIEFTGNTITRDRVIRRELLLEEGQVYNSQLWEMSLLRLNQLDYFDPLKVEQDSETHQDAQNGTVELLLKVKEKGKNSIGLNGGVSGVSGAFIGLNYQTNNFLGLGETLSVQANAGNVSRQIMFGFTEPYVRNRPLNLGFQVFSNKTDYNAAKNNALSGGTQANLSSAAQQLVQNYNQSSTGLTVSASYPIRRSFKRVGITYGLSRSSVTTFSTASQTLFQTLNFRSGISGPNALAGIVTSSIGLSFQYNTVNNPMRPRSGKEFSAALQTAGVWGNVRYIEPVLVFKQFIPVKFLRPDREGHNVFGYRAQLSYVQGFGGYVASPTNRFFTGGEADLRGFEVRAATPYAYIPTRIYANLTNPNGSTVPKDPQNPTLGAIQVPLPVYSVVSVGGDTSLTTNAEYRIPIAGPVTFAFFNDFGLDVALRQSQLKQSVEGAASLNAPLYGCPVYNNGACQGGHQITFDPYIRPIGGTNWVPRMSTGAELQVILPVVNAPMRLYYAINPLRLYQQIPGKNLITRDMFPGGSAGEYTYLQEIQAWGSKYQMREPSNTFRLTVSTTF
jgi:outer membrane protein insertion porin family